MPRTVVAAFAFICLGACASVPEMDIAPKGDDPGAAVRIVNQIACEITGSAGYAQLVAGNYYVSAAVTVTAEDKAGLTPSVSFIDLFGAAGNSYTSTVGGELSRARTRNYTQTFTIRAKDISCDPNASHRFAGSLGLDEVIRTGLKPLPVGATGGANADDKAAAFGSTIEFKVVRSANGGPAWVRPRFKGPGGANGLLGLSRTDTDKLVITFGPPKPPSKAGEEFLFLSEGARDASAAQASRDLLTIMTLQNLDIGR